MMGYFVTSSTYVGSDVVAVCYVGSSLHGL
jgi:hypothetical protein